MPTKKKQQTRQKKRLPGNVRQTKNRKALQGKKPASKPSGNTGGFAASVRMKLFGRADAPQTAQQSIPYREMYRDGICRVTDRLYTKTIAFQDITYQLAQNEDKTQIFENYCDFLNYFDSSVNVQLSFINQYGNLKEFQQSIDIPEQEDEYNSIRREYAGMLKNQLAKGNNGLVKTKYITFGIEADSLKAAKPRMERVEADILANFKTMGVKARALSGLERLEVFHGQFHPDGQEKLRFSWEDIPKTGLSTKDYIAPTGFDFRDGKTFRMGEHYGAVSFLSILAPELTDRMLADFLDLDTAVTVNLHIRSIDQAEAIKTVKRKLSDLDKMKIEEQKKAVRSGYDMDIIPTDLATYGNEAKTLLEDLQNRNERMFLVTVLVLNTAKKRQQLENDIFQAAGVAQKYNCALKRLDYQQEQGLMSSLPLGLNQIEIKRGLTTSSVAIFVPFTTQELFQQGEALYYGLNALSNNLIMASRKRLKNPNGLFLGTPGSGKSFAAKREIVNVFLLTNDDIIISDPEAEYFPLVNRLGGQVVKLSPVSAQHINPMDINPDYSDDEDPLTLKSDFILSLCELIVGGKEGLQPVEKTIIDRCVRLVYREYLANPSSEKMPILQDLYNLLRKQTEPEAQHIATALEIYVTGSLNVFNHRTNVDITNRLVCYDIKELGKQLKKLGMLILQDQVWGRVTANRAAHRTTWFYQDEFHLLLKEEQTAAYSVEIWKRFRKWGGIPSALTQNVKDLLASREIENILENSDFIYMLNQAGGDRQILAKQLGISNHQLSYVTHSGAGEGLLFYGNTIIPFIDRFPKDTELYRIMTTKPDEVKGA
ncbi:VirB4-like conjugal transfer ATPase, CD1110 family [Geosporobacter ferrireducens]|uniref:Conjugal transfer protein TraE n=2 Tax=Geosporobacter ferrireducens TaxID=1424294 RepID=A0A1D8GD00_9FIRM|nr:conjugal transfer protein TraE [Geosporobacter ferrireducens]